MKYKHVKRGTVYTLDYIFEDTSDLHMVEGDYFVWEEYGEICYAEVQSSNVEGTRGQPIVVYYGDDLYLWARAKDEFFDGRFEPC